MPTLQSKLVQQVRLQSPANRQVVDTQSLLLDPEDQRDMEEKSWLGRKSTLPRKTAIIAAQLETVYSDNSSKSMRELILELQNTDPTTRKIKERVVNPRRCTVEDKHWTFGPDQELLYQGKLFVPAEESVKQALLERYHDDPMAGHFGADRTFELLQRKYY
jgi:hypothetical protein